MYPRILASGKTLYILDEPTTGLHFEDIRVLMNVLNKLVDKGNTVIVIEHNLDVIKMADYIIDMGPEGGKGGGELLSCVLPVSRLESSVANFTRWLSPPESVVEDCPSLIYPRPTS